MASALRSGVAAAVPVGLMMGRSRYVAAFFNPLLMVIYPVPKAALMPIIMLWLGVGDASKTLVIFLGVTLPVIYHSYQGARAVEEKMLWSAAAMGMGPRARLVRIVLPAALPEIMVGCRTGLVLALITMVTSEMIARRPASAISCSIRSTWRSTTRSTPRSSSSACSASCSMPRSKRCARRLVAWAEPVA